MENPTQEIVAKLKTPTLGTTEATIQGYIFTLLTVAGLNLAEQQIELESPSGDGTRRRLDIEVGHLAIEVKKDLLKAHVKSDGEKQLAGYVQTRTVQVGARYVGVLTDGQRWYLYQLKGDTLLEVASLDISRIEEPAGPLLSWLEAILATQERVRPTPREIDRRLGAKSPAHKLDASALAAIYEASKLDRAVNEKRTLWAKLLRTAFGAGFDDSDELFLNHTILVLSAEIIAHAVLGYDVGKGGDLSPRDLALGTVFTDAQIRGVVQADFFDWVLDAPGGESFIADLARRVAQFDWAAVEHDVLKVLYESVIETDQRRRLGEYYTPDWLAERIVESTVLAPAEQRVMDPSCGSGTFLFHAVRQHIRARLSLGDSVGDALASTTRHVIGIDVHPVAVTLARVTYLLAMGVENLSDDSRGPIAIPVFLGDSLQWEQHADYLSYNGEITISTAGSDLVEDTTTALFGDDLVFPRSVLADADDFDALVTALAKKSTEASSRTDKDIAEPLLRRMGVPEHDLPVLVSTFGVLKKLHKDGSSGIWGYYVRNLVRPLWLAEPENRVDVLVGNPPWLRYAEMNAGMKKRFANMSKQRGLTQGKAGVSGRDLSTLFVVRACELYLRLGGSFAFVVPHGILTRQSHEGFRTGAWNTVNTRVQAAFSEAWDLSAAATGFPNHAAVVRGTLTDTSAHPLPTAVEKWATTGPLSQSNIPWAEMAPRLTVTPGVTAVTDASADNVQSPYKSRFRNGAQLQPRMLLFVNEVGSGTLGPGRNRVKVTSRRSSLEKDVWKEQLSLTHTVERSFVRDVYLGENVVPFGLLAPLRAVLPIKPDNQRLLSRDEIGQHEGLSAWWSEATQLRDKHKKPNDPSDLLDRIDFHAQLTKQLPAPRRRVVYTKAGVRMAAALVQDPMAVIEGKLYWGAVSSTEEGHYLTTILNSAALQEAVGKYQAIGLLGPRDMDKNLFRAPFPLFDSAVPIHRELAAYGREAAAMTEQVLLNAAEGTRFQKLRSAVRAALAAEGTADAIEALVAEIVAASVRE